MILGEAAKGAFYKITDAPWRKLQRFFENVAGRWFIDFERVQRTTKKPIDAVVCGGRSYTQKESNQRWDEAALVNVIHLPLASIAASRTLCRLLGVSEFSYRSLLANPGAMSGVLGRW